MKYNPNQMVFTASYADGNDLVIDNNKNEPNMGPAYYLCVFESEEDARRWAKEAGHTSIFFKKTTLRDLALELNSSLMWQDIVGIGYVTTDGMVEQLFVDEFIKLAYGDIQKSKAIQYTPLIVNSQITSDIAHVDFQKNWYVASTYSGKIFEERVVNDDGKFMRWLIVASSKKLLMNKAESLRFTNPNNNIEVCSLEQILDWFTDTQLWNKCSGVCFINENGETRIVRKRLNALRKSHNKILKKMKEESELFLDERFFVALDDSDDWSIIVEYGENGMEYMALSQHMDALYKMCKMQGLDARSLKYTNNITLREIIASVDDHPSQGFTICIDGDYNHFIRYTREELLQHCKHTMNDDDFIGNDVDFVVPKKSHILMIDNQYSVSTIASPLNEEQELTIIMMGDSKDSLLDGLVCTEFPLSEEDAVPVNWDMLVYDLSEGVLTDIDAIMYFKADGTYGIIFKDELLDDLEDN